MAWRKFKGVETQAQRIGNRVIIRSEADYPVPLEGGLEYFHVNSITADLEFNPTGSVVFSAIDSELVVLTSTTTNTMFTAQDQSITFNNIGLSCPNGKLMDYEDTIGNEGTNFIYLFNSGVFGAGSLGDLTNLSALFISTCAFGDINSGFNFFGNKFGDLDCIWTDYQISAGSFFDLGTAIFQGITVTDQIVDIDAGATFISGLPNSGNIVIGGFGAITIGRKRGVGNVYNGISPNDGRWDMDVNDTSFGNSRNACDLYLQGSSQVITVAGSNQWYEIGTPSGAVWQSTVSDRFTVGANGVLTYIGEVPIEVRITGKGTIEKVGGGSNSIEMRVAKNWTGATSDSGIEQSGSSTRSNQPTSVPNGCIASLSTGDTLQLIFANLTSSDDIQVFAATMEVAGE